MPFSILGLSPVICTPLRRIGYIHPTPVQAKCIPVVITGSDLMARAQTGTGKTAAFGLPMIERLLVRDRRPARPGRPRGLVLVPTRELAIQVHNSLASYGAAVNVRTLAVFGGVPMGAQVSALRQGVDIVVATPGRLIDHMQRRTVDLSAIEILTLDEADRMLDMGFLPPLRRVLAALPRQRQTLLLSATFSTEIVALSSEFTQAPVRIDVSEAQIVAPTITHSVCPVNDRRKEELLRHVLTEEPVGQALVFCKTKRGANRVGEALERSGVQSAVIHGNKSQGARNRALRDFKAGRVTVLVATDLAARGLDIAQLPLVVNYDLPLVAQDYVHRVGRTGRAGLTGRAISLVSPTEHGQLRDIQGLLPTPFERVIVSGFELSDAPRSAGAPVRHGQRHDRGRVKPQRNGARPHARAGSWRPRKSERVRNTVLR
jgi:ATP-dependent RNA helicase RhlE